MTIASSTPTPEMGTNKLTQKGELSTQSENLPRYSSTSTPHPKRIAITPIPILPKSEYGSPGHIASVEKLFGTEAAQQVIAHQQAIENHLSTALWHVRHGTGNLSIQAATGRAIRAATLLKQVSAESTTQRRA